MRIKLMVNALLKYLSGLLFLGLLLFIPAGTLNYLNAWLFIALLFIPMFIVGVVLLFRSPELLEKRLKQKETEKQQKIVILLSLIMFVGGFVLCGFDYRFGWSKLPFLVSMVAAAVMFIGYIMYAEVLRENAYLSRTVEVSEDQKVIDTGLYGVVRHPMYFSTILLFVSMPLVLGSLYGFLLFLLYPFLLVGRIKNEEAVLKEGLPGYDEYMKKVKYRLIPFIW